MKHFWLGLGVLLALLGASLWGWYTVEQVHGPLETAAAAAAEAALGSDWDRAADLTRQARDFWDRHREAVAALTGHRAVEEADRLLNRMELFLELGDGPRFAAACRELADLADAEADAQSLTWWNLF